MKTALITTTYLNGNSRSYSVNSGDGLARAIRLELEVGETNPARRIKKIHVEIEH